MSRMYEGFEMRDRHRQILTKHRLYLLHNMCVTEQLWATLISNNLLSPDMVEECKTGVTSAEKVGRLLDMIPQRGPEAFDSFCEALLECDHAHVAEYLKTLEATDQFASEIRPHCVDVSDNLTEKFIKIFQKSTPSVQRFAERKFQIIMEEQDRDLTAKEDELRDIENQNMFLQLEVTQLRSHINTCYETSENIAQEIQNKHVSKTFVKEETAHLKNLQKQLRDIKGFEKIRDFYENMIALLTFLAQARDKQLSTEHARAASVSRAMSTRGKSMHEKMQMLIEQLQNIAQRLGNKANVPGVMVKAELEHVIGTYKEIVGDVYQIRDAFKNNMRQKRKMEGEVLSMLHNFQEIRRLDREIKEKQSHITDLNKQGQFMRKKTVTKQNRKQIEQIQQTIDQKKLQIRDTQEDLDKHIRSADQRLHALLNLLPDLEDTGNEFLQRSDTEMTSSDLESHTGSNSRLGTPLGTVRPTSAIFNKNTYRKLAETLGLRDPLTNGLGNGTLDMHNKNDAQKPFESTSDSDSDTHPKAAPSDNVSEAKQTQNEVRAIKNDTKPLNTSPKVVRKQMTTKPVPQRARRKDTSPDRSRAQAQSRGKLMNGYTASQIDQWVTQEQANERKRNQAQRALSLPKAHIADTGKPDKTEKVEKSLSRAPTMLPIAEANTERETQAPNRVPPQLSTFPPPRQNSTLSPQANKPKQLPLSQARHSVDHGTRTVSKELYKHGKQRQSLTDFEHEKGYWETKNSSASSHGKNEENGSRPVSAKRSTELSVSMSNFDNSNLFRDGFVSNSKDTFHQPEVELEGPLTARKRKQSLLSPTDQNANVHFVDEQTSELTLNSRGQRSSRSSYKEPESSKSKLVPSNSREVLKANRIDLMI